VLAPAESGQYSVCRAWKPAAHASSCRQTDRQTTKTTNVLEGVRPAMRRYHADRPGADLKTMKVRLLPQASRIAAAMTMTRVGTRKSGMLEWPVLNA